MRIAIIVLCCSVAILGYALSDTLVLTTAFLGVLLFSLQYRRDLITLTRYTAQPERRRRVRNGLLLPVQPMNSETSLGQALQLQIEFLKRRVKDLHWESHEGVALERLWEEELLNGVPASGENGLTAAEYFEQILRFVMRGFRCKAAAIVIHGADGDFFSVGLSGARFERALREGYREYFQDGSLITFGVIDELERNRLVGNLAAFGIASSVSYPIALKESEHAKGTRAVLWLGYPSSITISVAESRAAKTLADRLNVEIRSREKLKELYHQVRSSRDQIRKKDDFITSMSHDIRAPLHNIRNILAQVRIDGPSTETPRLLESALSNCEHMGEIVEDILFLSRFQAGQLFAKRQLFELGWLVESLVDAFRVTAQQKGLLLECDIAPQGYVVHGDPKQVKRILSNLISNALKYTERGTITVGIERTAEDKIQLCVRDTGCGMSAEETEKLFQPYTRFEVVSVDGVGLGLAISRILTELNGGQLAARSKRNVGSEFILSFPRATGAEADELAFEAAAVRLNSEQISSEQINSEQKSEQAKDRAGSDLIERRSAHQILIVDDDRDATATMMRSIQRVGYRVTAANSVREALQHLERETFALVVTDGAMPDGGGRRVLSAIDSVFGGIPAIVVSGRDSASDHYELKALGAREIFAKPANHQELITRIDAILFDEKVVPLRVVNG
jgi:signal transduction histidine kinase/CheY-like chemotaxis protein